MMIGAPGRNRTSTVLPPPDFESGASTNSATGAGGRGYNGAPLGVMVLLGDHAGARRKVLIAALAAIALGMLWNAGLGVYHAGVEWKLWAGPQECSGALEGLGSAGGLIDKLQSISVVRCDDAAW